MFSFEGATIVPAAGLDSSPQLQMLQNRHLFLVCPSIGAIFFTYCCNDSSLWRQRPAGWVPVEPASGYTGNGVLRSGRQQYQYSTANSVLADVARARSVFSDRQLKERPTG